jgi:hypothetical protein
MSACGARGRPLGPCVTGGGGGTGMRWLDPILTRFTRNPITWILALFLLGMFFAMWDESAKHERVCTSLAEHIQATLSAIEQETGQSRKRLLREESPAGVTYRAWHVVEHGVQQLCHGR